MSTPSDTAAQSLADTSAEAPAAFRRTQPFLWSVRRELWEHRAVFIAPLAAAGVVLFGFFISTTHVSHAARVAFLSLKPADRQMILLVPYASAAFSIYGTGLIVAVFYGLSALYNERRDRSILFWKSLPVSDLWTVLSKATVPLLILPLVIFAVVVVTQIVMLGVTTAILAANGLSGGLAPVPLVKLAVIELYAVFVFALWHAPIYGWFFLVSAWARRVAFLWAVLPPLGLCIVEHIAFDTGYLTRLLLYRLGGVIEIAFGNVEPHAGKFVIDPGTQLNPIGFLTNPGLWVGLAAAAALFAGAIWLRRYREPM